MEMIRRKPLQSNDQQPITIDRNTLPGHPNGAALTPHQPNPGQAPVPALPAPTVPAPAMPGPVAQSPAQQPHGPIAPVPTGALTATAAVPTRSGGGPGAFGAAFGLGALVLVGGLSFAVGRWSVDEIDTNPDSGTPLRIGAAGGPSQANPGRQAAVDDVVAGRVGRGTQAEIDPPSLPQELPDSAGSADGSSTDVAPAVLSGPSPAVLDADAVQAQVPDEDRSAAIDETPRGQGAPGGLPPGGIQAVVTGIASTEITVLDESAETLRFAIDQTTLFLSESAIDPATLVPGEVVQISLPFWGPDDRSAAEPDTPGVALTVTVLAPGSSAGGGRRGQRGDDALSGAAAAPSGQGAPGGLRGQGGAGGRGGFGRAGLGGTIVDVADDAITLELVNGETQTIATDSATSFVRQVEADLSEVSLDDAVRIQAARGGIGQAGGTASVQDPVPAAQIAILLDLAA